MSSVAEWLQSAGLERHARAFDGVSDAAFAGLLMQVRSEKSMSNRERGRKKKSDAVFSFFFFSLSLRLRGEGSLELATNVDRRLSRKLGGGECSSTGPQMSPSPTGKERRRKERRNLFGKANRSFIVRSRRLQDSSSSTTLLEQFSLNLETSQTLQLLSPSLPSQDFARFGVVELDEKQRLYRLIKAIQSQQKPSSQWCPGRNSNNGGAPLSPAAAPLFVEVAADASAASVPSPSSSAGPPPPPPPPQLRLSSPGGGGKQQHQQFKPLSRDDEPARANAPALPGPLSSFEIDVSQESGAPAEEEEESAMVTAASALDDDSPPSPTSSIGGGGGVAAVAAALGMEASPPAVRAAPAAAAAAATAAAAAATTAAAPPPPPSSSPPSPRIKVVVRKRPLNAAERLRGEADVLDARACDRTVVVAEPRTRVDCSRYVELQEFEFDAVLDEAASGDDVYGTAVAPLVRACARGGRATVFAYGQTGSGKTFTMGKLPERAAAELLERMRRWEEEEGEEEREGEERRGREGVGNAGEEAGARNAPSSSSSSSSSAPPNSYSYGLWVSCFEIYGGKLFDLLNGRNKLDAREDAQGRVVIAHLRHARVRSPTDVAAVASAAERARSTGSTGANADSSRSHCVTQFSLYRLPAKRRSGGGGEGGGKEEVGGGGGLSRNLPPPTSSAATRRKRAEEEAAARSEEEAERAAATARAAVERFREGSAAAGSSSGGGEGALLLLRRRR